MIEGEFEREHDPRDIVTVFDIDSLFDAACVIDADSDLLYERDISLLVVSV